MSSAELRARVDTHRLSLAVGAMMLALIAATSGDQAVAVKAVGADARLINAAIPFAGGPIQAPRPSPLAVKEWINGARCCA